MGGVPARRGVLLGALLVSAVLTGCAGGDAPSGPFAEVGSQAGFDYQIDLGLPPNVAQMAFLGGGIAVADVNDDGWPDVYVGDRNQNVLYINDGDGTFSDRTREWKAWDAGITRAPAFLDYDSDGDWDLFVGNFITQSRLYRNDGDRFTNVTEQTGVGWTTTTHNVATGDYDGDGHVDLFLGVYGDVGENSFDSMTESENGEPNLLLRNNGDGTFKEVSLEVGLDKLRWSFASGFADFDQDGDQDLYVANDFGWDSLYVNENGSFTEQGRQRDAVVNRNGMGATWFDYDNDLDLDLYVTNIYVEGSELPSLQGNVLYRNDGDGTFTDVSFEAGVADGGWSWDAEAFDADNDGDQDLYVANGFASRGEFDVFYDGRFVLEEGRPDGPGVSTYGLRSGWYNSTHSIHVDPATVPPGVNLDSPRFNAIVSQGGYQADRLFINQGDGTFVDRAVELGAGLEGDGRAVAALDKDRDGDIDLVVTEARKNVRLLENRWATGHWLQVELDPGDGRGADALGARVLLTAGNTTQLRVMHGAMGFMSQAEPLLHFGLGNATQVDEIVVTWPWGEQTTVTQLEADRYLTITPEGPV